MSDTQALINLIRFHETGGHEGKGEDADLIDAKAELTRLTTALLEAEANLESQRAETERHHKNWCEAEAKLAKAREALIEMFEAVCGETGFAQAVRAESGFAYPWPALDIAEAMTRACLAELGEG